MKHAILYLALAYALGCLTVYVMEKDRYYKLIPEERILLERIVYGTHQIETDTQRESESNG